MELFDRKKELRQKFRQIRKKIERRAEKEQAALNTLLRLQEWQEATTPLLYISTASEIDTHRLIEIALDTQKRVVVPYCKNRSGEMGIALISSFDDLEIGAFGILEPKKECRDKLSLEDLDFILVPAIAFDQFGGRLGQGKGFYDRFLKTISSHIPVVGLAFEEQISQDSLPMEEHDRRVSLLITNKGERRW